ncbi:MAG: hypothetical protein C0482_19470 [Gordonia sp.]|jgi:uncharacterized membrane protein YidH (DUF202 family)|uniref:DUF202 domain-containing protein n=1 Tax=Gordonia rubripertincta TaxID=36822 RepID=A0ABT4MWA2_GORRU|nr:hypothetical protein [Gordonia rubripertincta]MBA4024537.1 hypothetical protein [Gordonia sp. (in: high G+C Gram-positive bacteria)]MCZ4551293.1 hypothetical protein [Gordonia rubripertincta]
MTTTESRADRFTRELAELKIPDPASGRAVLWLRIGIALLVLGPVLGIIAYFMSHGTSNPLVQRDAIIIALIGISSAVVGSAVFLRYSLTNFLRFWLARQAFDLSVLADRLSPNDIPLVEKDEYHDKSKHAVTPR